MESENIMKKKDIKIIKEKSSSDINYTFIDSINRIKPDNVSSLNAKNEQDADDKRPLESYNTRQEKYTKKKAISKNESVKKFKALKFSNPSQRNHSSVYE